MAARRKGPWLRWPMPRVLVHRASETRSDLQETNQGMEEGFTPTTVFVLPSSQNLRDAIRASRPEPKGPASQRMSPRNMP